MASNPKHPPGLPLALGILAIAKLEQCVERLQRDRDAERGTGGSLDAPGSLAKKRSHLLGHRGGKLFVEGELAGRQDDKSNMRE